MFECVVYGLGLQLNLPLSGLAGLLPATSIDVKVEITLSTPGGASANSIVSDEFCLNGDHDEFGNSEMRVLRSRASGSICLTYSDGLVFIINAQGSRVWVTVPAEQTVEDMAPALLGPIMGVVLRLRGITCLHASAVAIDGLAVGLVGVSGAGKSTTAAAFARLGYPVLTEDVLALEDCVDHFKVRPSYPRVRLWPQSVAGLFGASDALPRMTPNWEKRFMDLRASGYRFQSEPLPLAAIYFLGPRVSGPGDTQVNFERPAKALLALVSDSYGTNFLDKFQRAKEFEVLSRLVEDLPLRHVTAMDDFSRINDLCNAVVQDFRVGRARAAAAIL